ncbi:MAG: DUF4382 domain-containing protein [Methanothrix sp.]|jgi:hypothetical protein
MVNKAVSYIIGIIVILAIIYIAIGLVTPRPSIATTTVSPSVSSNGTVALMLTDPAQVPSGTTALNVTFSGARLHETGATNSSGFVNINASGTIDLLSLLNVSQTLGIASLNKTKSYDSIILNVSSSTITINGTTYNVTLPSNKLDVHVSNVNATSGAVLVDLSPTIVQIISTNQTMFVMVPSVKAVIVGSSNVNSTVVKVGARARLNANIHSKLSLATPKIAITSASLSEEANHTDFSVTVKNSGNSTAYVNHILLFGIMGMNLSAGANARLHAAVQQVPEPYLFQSSGFGGITSIISQYSNGNYNLSSLYGELASKYGANLSTGIKAGISSALESHNISGFLGHIANSSINLTAITSNYSAFNSEFGFNVSPSEFNSIRANMQNKLNLSVMESMHNFNVSNVKLRGFIQAANAFDGHYHNMMAFIISTNGTLMLPFDANQAEGPQGYSIAPGSSATFSYNGIISAGNGKLVIMPLQNQTYSVRVTGEEGAVATSNVIAS